MRQHDAVAVLGGQRVRLLVADSPRHGSSGSTATVRRSSTRARTCADRVRMRSRSSPSQISVCSGTPPLWVERRGGGGAAGRPMGQTILARSGTGSALAPERSGRHRHTIETSPAPDVRDEAVAPHEPAHPNGRLTARIAQIEKSRNVTIDVLDAYVSALGGQLEVNVLRAGRRTKIVGAPPNAARIPQRFNALNVRNRRAADSAESAEKRPDSIEVKGAWNREVPTAIDDQLAGRYMGDLHTNVGIYVVVWPGDSHWSETDGRRSQVPDRRQTVEQLRMQAASYAESGRTIEVVHIDIPYERADLDHKPDPKAYGDG